MQSRNKPSKTTATPKKAPSAATSSNADFASLEARIAALEKAAVEASQRTSERTSIGASNAKTNKSSLPIDGDDRFWALNELTRQQRALPEDKGAVLYTGTIALPSGAQYVWQRQDSTRELLEQDWRNLSETIAALGHPMRLEILKYALGEERSTQDFMSLPEMGTTGQLFHHIKALQDAGWLRSLQRGLYGVPGERVVPLLAILAAARG
jgi:DNA-binding transcriptional ArsR family regulator